MADNTILNAGTGGDTIRTIAKTATGAKTGVTVIDVGGGADASPETPLVAGQQTKAASLSVVPASDLSSLEPAGAAITGATMPTGGLGLTGWLSAIWKTLQTGLARSWTLSSGADSVTATVANSSLAVTGTFWQATQPVSLSSLPALAAGSALVGKVGLDQTSPGSTNATYDTSYATHAPAYAPATATTSAQSLSSLAGSIPAWATMAFVTAETTAIPALRYRADGTAPTAAAGMPIPGWTAWPIQGAAALAAAQIISATGASVAISVEFRA